VTDEVEAQIVRMYQKWSGALVGYAMSWAGGDLGDAEELVEDAFHLLYQKWDQVAGFNDKGRYGWLRTVVRNRAVDAFRRRGRIIPLLVDPLDENADCLDQACADTDPVRTLLAHEHTVLARDLVDRCMTVIHSMPEHLRIALLLRGDAQTSSQIGDQMGVDSSTVRGYWKQAIKELTATVGHVIRILDDEIDEQDLGVEEKA
jgi:RNA polymerase sigma factor (sigma-70 family)